MTNGSAETGTETKVKLYLGLVDQLHKYTTIFWQVPTALFAANLLALDKFSGMPLVLFTVTLFNATLLFAFRRMIVQQQKIIQAARDAEADLKAVWSKYVPEFSHSCVRAPDVMFYLLVVLDSLLGIYSLGSWFRAQQATHVPVPQTMPALLSSPWCGFTQAALTLVGGFFLAFSLKTMKETGGFDTSDPAPQSWRFYVGLILVTLAAIPSFVAPFVANP